MPLLRLQRWQDRFRKSKKSSAAGRKSLEVDDFFVQELINFIRVHPEVDFSGVLGMLFFLKQIPDFSKKYLFSRWFGFFGHFFILLFHPVNGTDKQKK